MALYFLCDDLAYRDLAGNIYLEWFNFHEDGGQAFMCPNKKLLYIFAPPSDNPKPEDFRAFLSDGTHGVMVNPNVWHTNPIPLEDKQVVIQNKQCNLDITKNCHLAAEHFSWLIIEGLL